MCGASTYIYALDHGLFRLMCWFNKHHFGHRVFYRFSFGRRRDAKRSEPSATRIAATGCIYYLCLFDMDDNIIGYIVFVWIYAYIEFEYIFECSDEWCGNLMSANMMGEEWCERVKSKKWKSTNINETVSIWFRILYKKIFRWCW